MTVETVTVHLADSPPEFCEDGWVKPKITYTMDGKSYVLALFRYGDRYFFRDAGVGLTKTRCSFNIRCEDLKACIEQADREPSPLGDILNIELYQDDTPVPPPYEVDTEERTSTRGMTLLDYMEAEDDRGAGL